MIVFGDLEKKISEIKQNPFYIPYIEKLKREYEAEREKDPPALSYTDFEEFYISGKRRT